MTAAAPSRIAILSDVHGNVTALRAVLADIESRGIRRIFNLGDVIGKGPRGAEACSLSRDHCEVTIRGNWDDYIAKTTTGLDAASQWWKAELDPADLVWLGGLPNSHDLRVSGRAIRLVHASSTSEYVRVMFHHTAAEFAAMFANTPFTGDGPEPTVVGYGDVHDAYLEVDDGRTLFNVGSVGNPLDEATASYVIMEGVVDGGAADPFGLQFVRVPYDIEDEIEVARERDMPKLQEYATELRTAIYRGRHAQLGLLESSVPQAL